MARADSCRGATGVTDNRLADYLAHMRRAALQACDYVRGMDKRTFLADMRTQQAAIMNLIVIGEAATQIMERDPEFVRANAGVPWRNMRGMRNRNCARIFRHQHGCRVGYGANCFARAVAATGCVDRYRR